MAPKCPDDVLGDAVGQRLIEPRGRAVGKRQHRDAQRGRGRPAVPPPRAAGGERDSGGDAAGDQFAPLECRA